MKNVNCLVDGMWNVAVKKAKKWSGHTSNVCKDETRWDLERVASFLFRLLRIREILERVTRVDLLIRCLMVHWFIRAVEAENYLVMDAFECDHGIHLETMVSVLCLDFWQWQASIPHPAGRGHVAQRGDPFGEKKHDFSDSAWQLKKKTWNTYNIPNDWTYFDLILNEKRRCWYVHNISWYYIPRAQLTPFLGVDLQFYGLNLPKCGSFGF